MDARTGRVVAAAALAGLLGALVLTLLVPETYRATGTLALSRAGRAPGDDPKLAPAARAAAELLESRTVADSTIANLGLDESPEELLARVDVEHDAGTSLLRLHVEARDREEARRTAQELAEVFAVLYNTRFGAETTATIWDVPRADDDAVSPRPARILGLGALGGALVALLAVALVRRRADVLGARGATRSPHRAPAPPFSTAARWAEPAAVSFDELERRVGAAATPLPTWSHYLVALREFRDVEGRLPRHLEPLLDDVFGDVAGAR